MLLLSVVSVCLCACGPKMAPPLVGVAPANATLPRFELPQEPRQLTFKWELEDGSMVARGEGVARVAPPDSARVDLFLAGGLGGASALLIGDSIHVPSAVRDLVPPAPLLWAALGRLALPPVADTIIRVQGDTLRADFGRPSQWRITAWGGALRRVEHLQDGHVSEFVEHSSDTRVRYQSAAHRSLVLNLERTSTVAPFDASIWRH